MLKRKSTSTWICHTNKCISVFESVDVFSSLPIALSSRKYMYILTNLKLILLYTKCCFICRALFTSQEAPEDDPQCGVEMLKEVCHLENKNAFIIFLKPLKDNMGV